MKLLYVTDIHCKMSSTARQDDYYTTCIGKIEWLIDRCNSDDDVLGILMGGDIGDSYTWPSEMMNKLISLFEQCKKPVITIVGNHDVYSRNTYLYENCSLHTLAKSGGVPLKIIPPESTEPVILGDFEIYGFSADTKISKKLITNEYVHVRTSDRTTVAVVHENVGPKDSIYCKGFRKVPCKGFDIALFGDIHTGWKPTKLKSGCISANPGSLMRTSVADIDRKPKILEVYTDKVVEVVVPHEHKDKVFKIKEIKDTSDEAAKAFLAAIARKENTNVTNPEEIIKSVGNSAGYSEESIQLLLEEIKE